MSTQADSIRQAQITLTKVLADQGVTAANPDVLYWLLGQVYGESFFGTSDDWTIPNALNDATSNPLAPNGPSHNWGAVRAYGDSTPFIWHKDRDANGVIGTYKFARPGSPEAGAKLYFKALLRTDLNKAVTNVLNDLNATPWDLARAMYTRSEDTSVRARSPQAYYTGTPDQGDDTGRITAYGNMIAGQAAKLKKIVGTPPTPSPTPLDLLPGITPGTVVGKALSSPLPTIGIGVGLFGLGYLAYRHLKR